MSLLVNTARHVVKHEVRHVVRHEVKPAGKHVGYATLAWPWRKRKLLG
jgi:hypothetical protein